jgi:hypothetical protein
MMKSSKQLTSEAIDQDDMSNISELSVSSDVSISEFIEPIETVYMSVNGGSGEKNGPRHEPNRSESVGHDAEEANKEIGV